MTPQLSTPKSVLDALGGVGAVAAMTGFSYSRVWNWKNRGFPADTYALLVRELNKRGLTAPQRLWRQLSRLDD